MDCVSPLISSVPLVCLMVTDMNGLGGKGSGVLLRILYSFRRFCHNLHNEQVVDTNQVKKV